MSLECTVKLDAWKHGGDPPTKGRSKYLAPCARTWVVLASSSLSSLQVDWMSMVLMSGDKHHLAQ